MKFCYVIIEGQRDEKGYIPSAVFEGRSGHYPMTGQGKHAEPWHWGETVELAEEVCARMNERMGITKKEALGMVIESMRGLDH